MREIKFRAWDKEEKLMLYDIQLYLEHKDKDGNEYDGYEDWKFDDFLTDSDIEVMQYTGLLDKNGTEIYEGDIVTNANGTTHFSDDDYSFPFKVTWSNAKNYTGFNVKKKHCKWYEVIGNIYENPELLTKGETKQ